MSIFRKWGKCIFKRSFIMSMKNALDLLYEVLRNNKDTHGIWAMSKYLEKYIEEGVDSFYKLKLDIVTQIIENFQEKGKVLDIKHAVTLITRFKKVYGNSAILLIISLNVNNNFEHSKAILSIFDSIPVIKSILEFDSKHQKFEEKKEETDECNSKNKGCKQLEKTSDEHENAKILNGGLRRSNRQRHQTETDYVSLPARIIHDKTSNRSKLPTTKQKQEIERTSTEKRKLAKISERVTVANKQEEKITIGKTTSNVRCKRKASTPKTKKIKIKIMSDDRSFTVNIEENDNVKALIQAVENVTQIPSNKIGLYYLGSRLFEANPIEKYGIKDGATLIFKESRKVRIDPDYVLL